MSKVILFLLFNISLYSSSINIEAISFHNNKPYSIYNTDILFINDGIKFNILTKKERNIDISYRYNNKKHLLQTIHIKSDTSISFPKNNDTLIFDNLGVVSFIFEENKTLLKQIDIRYINNNIKKLKLSDSRIKDKISIPKIDTKLNNNLSYFPAPNKIITTQRGLKETKIYNKLIKKVVLIKTKDSIGAGVVISNNGKILTNWHVIKNNKFVQVAFKPKSKYKTIPSLNSFLNAKVIKIDTEKDLALLQILDKQSINNIKAIKLSTLDKIDIGNDIFTIGHPQNQLFTLDNGIISQIRDSYSWNTHKANYIIQTKNSISSGNSGGPLVNEDLELIGINTFSNTKGQNLNYAVSIFDIKKFLKSDNKSKALENIQNIEDQKIKYKILDIKHGFDTNGNKLVTYFMDSNDNNIVDLVAIDLYANGIKNYYLFDTNEDGKYDKKAYDKDGDGIIERTLEY
jgi:serine protease Do